MTIQLLASFNASNQPLLRFGYYTSGDITTKNELFTLNTGDAQTTTPTALGATTFDPGTSEFSLYTIFPHFLDNGQPRISYSEDALNTWDTAVPRKFRFFPMENADGSVVPNAFVMTVEDNNIPFGDIQPYDANDIVGDHPERESCPRRGLGRDAGLAEHGRAPVQQPPDLQPHRAAKSNLSAMWCTTPRPFA